jgi:hypothetical protein
MPNTVMPQLRNYCFVKLDVAMAHILTDIRAGAHSFSGTHLNPHAHTTHTHKTHSYSRTQLPPPHTHKTHKQSTHTHKHKHKAHKAHTHTRTHAQGYTCTGACKQNTSTHQTEGQLSSAQLQQQINDAICLTPHGGAVASILLCHSCIRWHQNVAPQKASKVC